MESERGLAKLLACFTGCGRAAVHWAYQHTAGNEELVSETGQPFSMNVWVDYEAMCGGCHSKLDRITEKGQASLKSRMEADPTLAESYRQRGLAIARLVRENPEMAAKQRAQASLLVKSLNSTMKECVCGMVVNVGAMAMHKKHTGHLTVDEQELLS